MQLVDVGLVVVVVEEVELGGGRVEEVVMGASGETGVVMASLEFGGGDVVLVTDETKVAELVEVTEMGSSPASVTGLVVSNLLVECEEAVMMTGITASPPASGGASTERIPFGSGKVDLVNKCVDAMETRFSLLGAETIFGVVTEGVVIVVELEVTEMFGVMEVEVTETVAGGSVGAEVLVRVVGTVVVGGSVVVASGIDGLLSSSVTFVGVVAAAVGLTESVHISVLEGGTVLEGEIVKLVESGTEFEIAGKVERVVVAVRAGAPGVHGAAVGLSLVGVFVSPSCIWASSFSGVLRPDVAGGGPGLITGFGSKAGFPADSCADTLGRI